MKGFETVLVNYKEGVYMPLAKLRQMADFKGELIAKQVKEGDAVIYRSSSVWEGTFYRLYHVKKITATGRVKIEETSELTDIYGKIGNDTEILPVSQASLLEYNAYNLKHAIRHALTELNSCIMDVTTHYDDKEELAQKIYSLLETVQNKVGTEIKGVDLLSEMDRLQDLLNERTVLTTEKEEGD